MTTAQVVETSVTVNNNSPIQDYVYPDDQTQPTFGRRDRKPTRLSREKTTSEQGIKQPEISFVLLFRQVFLWYIPVEVAGSRVHSNRERFPATGP